jgi:UDP-N-acetylglucosamine 2-epimerase (non-hydrolysing)
MKKKKILIILGTRPEIIRLSLIIKNIRKYFKACVVNTNQNFDNELNNFFFNELDLKKADYNLQCHNRNPIEFISDLFPKIDKVLDVENPDAVLILGDTNSGLSALCAKKRKIPIFHIEAGNRCFDSRVPEEINRKLIDVLSDINMTYSEFAKQNLIKENFDLDKIIKIGSPLPEVFSYYKKKINDSEILEKLKLDRKKYFLVSCHREENIDNQTYLNNILTSLNKISEIYKNKVIFSTHPRTRNKLKKINKKISKDIIFFKPFKFFDYLKLQINSRLTLSDSGSIVEESNILKFPAINLRNTTERQEGMEKGSVIMSGLNVSSILQSVDLVLSNFDNSYLETHPDYTDLNVSEKVVNILQSYIDYINFRTWMKPINN